MDGLLQEELASVREVVPIKYMNWTKRLNDDEPQDYIRICVPEAKSEKFPTRLRVFGEAVLYKELANVNNFKPVRSVMTFMLIGHVSGQISASFAGQTLTNGPAQNLLDL